MPPKEMSLCISILTAAVAAVVRAAAAAARVEAVPHPVPARVAVVPLLLQHRAQREDHPQAARAALQPANRVNRDPLSLHKALKQASSFSPQEDQDHRRSLARYSFDRRMDPVVALRGHLAESGQVQAMPRVGSKEVRQGRKTMRPLSTIHYRIHDHDHRSYHSYPNAAERWYFSDTTVY